MSEKNGNGNGNAVKLGGMKLPIAVIGVIVVQAFGIIWYVANMDSTVKNMQQNVTQMQEAATTVDVAVMQTDIVNLKEKIIMMDEMHGTKFDPEPLEEDIDDLDEELHLALEKLTSKMTEDLRALETQMDFRLMDVSNDIEIKTEDVRMRTADMATALGEMRSYVDMRSGEASNSARGRVENLQSDFEWRLEEAENDIEFKLSEQRMELDNVRSHVEDNLAWRIDEMERQFPDIDATISLRLQDLDSVINYKVDEIRGELDDMRRSLEDQYNERFTSIENTMTFALPTLTDQIMSVEDQLNYNWQDLDFKIDEISQVQEHDRANVTTGFANLAVAARDALDQMKDRIEMAEDDLEERIRWIEQIVAVVENEMRTIMSDHEQFNVILREMGREGYGDQREYGDYEQQSKE